MLYIEFLHNIFTIPEEIYRGWAIMEELSYVDKSAHFWSVGDRKRVFNTVMLIYRHDMSSGLQEYVSIWT